MYLQSYVFTKDSQILFTTMGLNQLTRSRVEYVASVRFDVRNPSKHKRNDIFFESLG
jgi:hypothetical protein